MDNECEASGHHYPIPNEGLIRLSELTCHISLDSTLRRRSLLGRREKAPYLQPPSSAAVFENQATAGGSTDAPGGTLASVRTTLLRSDSDAPGRWLPEVSGAAVHNRIRVPRGA